MLGYFWKNGSNQSAINSRQLVNKKVNNNKTIITQWQLDLET